MAQDKYIKTHQQKLEVLRQEVKDKKQEIMDNIDVDEMMMNPKEYLSQIAKEFYNSNGEKFKKAVDSGKELANTILKETEND